MRAIDGAGACVPVRVVGAFAQSCLINWILWYTGHANAGMRVPSGTSHTVNGFNVYVFTHDFVMKAAAWGPKFLEVFEFCG